MTYECGHRWQGAGAIPPGGYHQCIKPLGHTTDPTNDDHKCCCGAAHEEDGNA